MSRRDQTVTDAKALLAASKDGGIGRIIVSGAMIEAPSIRLAPGQVLEGAGENACIAFAAGGEGVQLSSDNTVRGIRLETAPERRAIPVRVSPYFPHGTTMTARTLFRASPPSAMS